jgi:mycothiol synthase
MAKGSSPRYVCGMLQPSNQPDAIVVVPENLRPSALSVLWEHADESVREALSSQFEAESHTIDRYWSALVGKWNGSNWEGVAWAQFHVGRAASLHGPTLRVERPELAAQLVAAAISHALQDGVCIVQALRDLESTLQTQALLDAGFKHVTDLLYMFCDTARVSPHAPETRLRFEPWSAAENARLARLIERTYVHSLDCPAVDGIRPVEDVMAGYRATGVFDPSRWLLVTRRDANSDEKIDIGCLLLADHPTTDQFELVYMGVVPEERGHGWGFDMVRHALCQTHRAERKRLVLAVDSANRPGVRMYASAGFHTFEQKALYLRVK